MLPTYADQVFACRRGDLAKGIIKTNLGDFVTVTPITRRVRYGGGGGGFLPRFSFCHGARGSGILGLEQTNAIPLASSGVYRSSYYIRAGGLLLLEPTGW